MNSKTKITKEMLLRCVLNGACKIPPIGEELSSLEFGDLIWAEKVLHDEEKLCLKTPLWTFSLSGSGSGYSGSGYGYGSGDGSGSFGYGYSDYSGYGPGYSGYGSFGYGFGDSDGSSGYGFDDSDGSSGYSYSFYSYNLDKIFDMINFFKKRRTKMKGKRAVLVTTEFRGVFFGYIIEDKNSPLEIKLSDARNCIYWSSDCGGFLGLASNGPTQNCKIGRQVGELTLYKITSITEVNEKVAKIWEDFK